MLNILKFSQVQEMYNLDWSIQIGFFELPNHVSQL